MSETLTPWLWKAITKYRKEHGQDTSHECRGSLAQIVQYNNYRHASDPNSNTTDVYAYVHDKQWKALVRFEAAAVNAFEQSHQSFTSYKGGLFELRSFRFVLTNKYISKPPTQRSTTALGRSESDTALANQPKRMILSISNFRYYSSKGQQDFAPQARAIDQLVREWILQIEQMPRPIAAVSANKIQSPARRNRPTAVSADTTPMPVRRPRKISLNLNAAVAVDTSAGQQTLHGHPQIADNQDSPDHTVTAKLGAKDSHVPTDGPCVETATVSSTPPPPTSSAIASASNSGSAEQTASARKAAHPKARSKRKSSSPSREMDMAYLEEESHILRTRLLQQHANGLDMADDHVELDALHEAKAAAESPGARAASLTPTPTSRVIPRPLAENEVQAVDDRAASPVTAAQHQEVAQFVQAGVLPHGQSDSQAADISSVTDPVAVCSLPAPAEAELTFPSDIVILDNIEGLVIDSGPHMLQQAPESPQNATYVGQQTGSSTEVVEAMKPTLLATDHVDAISNKLPSASEFSDSDDDDFVFVAYNPAPIAPRAYSPPVVKQEIEMSAAYAALLGYDTSAHLPARDHHLPAVNDAIVEDDTMMPSRSASTADRPDDTQLYVQLQCTAWQLRNWNEIEEDFSQSHVEQEVESSSSQIVRMFSDRLAQDLRAYAADVVEQSQHINIGRDDVFGPSIVPPVGNNVRVSSERSKNMHGKRSSHEAPLATETQPASARPAKKAKIKPKPFDAETQARIAETSRQVDKHLTKYGLDRRQGIDLWFCCSGDMAAAARIAKSMHKHGELLVDDTLKPCWTYDDDKVVMSTDISDKLHGQYVEEIEGWRGINSTRRRYRFLTEDCLAKRMEIKPRFPYVQ